MRKKRPVDALFGLTRQRVLAATLLHPDRSWYLSDLAKHLKLRPSTLQRELGSLAAAGVLKRTANGNRVYYQADPACPFIEELQGLLVKTVGIVDVVREALTPFGHQISFAFIHGSFARSEQISESDVDLMVVGSTGLARLSPALRRAERLLTRSVNVTVYTPAEFKEKARSKNHFLLEVLRDKKIMIIGDADDLPEPPR